MIVALLIGIVLLGIYFIPSLVAVERKHPQVASIVILNSFLGWTIFIWVGCLAWAVVSFKAEKKCLKN